MVKLQKKNRTKRFDLTIVIPANREERRIGHTLDELAAFLISDAFFKNVKVEVIVVTADAPDKTNTIVESKQKLFRQFVLLKPGPHVGKGRDVQFGMLRAHGKKIVFMDADLATPLHHLKEFYDLCEAGNDLVIGTRDLFHYRSNALRNLFAGIGNRLYQLTSGIHVEDTQCGFKMFTYEACEQCFSKQTIMGWGFDVELLAIAKANGLMIKPIRIADWGDKPFSTYNENALRITARMVRDFAHISRLKSTGYYTKNS